MSPKTGMPWTWVRPVDAERLVERHTQDFWDASVVRLDISGTGLEHEVFAQVADVLRHFTARESLTHRPDLACAAELAAKADFVDYGCALRVAWPTDAGAAWLRDYDAWTAQHA